MFVPRPPAAPASSRDPTGTTPSLEFGMKKEADGMKNQREVIDISSSTQGVDGKVVEGAGRALHIHEGDEPRISTIETPIGGMVGGLAPFQQRPPRIEHLPENEALPSSKRTSVAIRRRPESEEEVAHPLIPRSPVFARTRLPSSCETGPQKKSSKNNVERCGDDMNSESRFRDFQH